MMLKAIVFMHFLLTGGAMATAAWSQTAQVPVIVIPGILGSRLCDVDGEVIWGDRTSLFKFNRLMMPLSSVGSGDAQLKPCGLIEKIRTVAFFNYHQYDTLFDNLGTLEYERGQTLLDFPYDWRLSNFHTAKLLKEFVEQKFPARDQKVDIVAHSMGGLIARIYVQQLGGEDKVRKLVMMGTPHRGSQNVFLTLEEGWEAWKNLAAGGLPVIRETMMSFPAMYQLLPADSNCCAWRKENGPILGQFRAWDEKAWRTFHWLPERYRSAEGQKFLAGALKETRQLQELMQQPIPGAVQATNIVTGHIVTRSRSYFDPDNGRFAGFETGFGDGTVTEWSAANDRPSEARAAVSEHARIFADTPAPVLIRWLLGAAREPASVGRLESVYRVTLTDRANRRIELAGVAPSLKPYAVSSGAMVSVGLRLLGAPTLADADLSNITFSLREEAGVVPLPTTAGPVSRKGTDFVRDLIASFRAPAEPGAYAVAIHIPGVGSLEEQFVVLER